MNFKTIIFYLAITILVSCGPEKVTGDNKSEQLLPSCGQTEQELKYLQTRNSYISYFKRLRANTHIEWSALDKQMDSSSTVLEKMLRDIMKSSQLESIALYGKISLSSLLEGDLGFGSLDGLLLDEDSFQIFVTSKFLFNEFFKSEMLNYEDNLNPQQLDNILTSSLGGGEARTQTLFSEKKSSPKSSTVYPVVGGFGQESAPLVDKCIFVIALKRDYVYIVWKFNSITELEVCKTLYDNKLSDAQKFSEIYRESKLNDTASLNKSFALEEEALNLYCECYQNNLKNDSQFEGLQHKIEKLMQYIEQ